MGRKSASSIDRMKVRLLRKYEAIGATRICITNNVISVFIKTQSEAISIHESDIRLRYRTAQYLSDKRFQMRLGPFTKKTSYEQLNIFETTVLHMSNKKYRRLLKQHKKNFFDKFYT